MSIYTKTGDEGTTSLIGGERVSKADARVEAYGTVDELAAHLGLLGDFCVALADAAASPPRLLRQAPVPVQGFGRDGWIVEQIAEIQKDLMIVMGVLAGGCGDVPKTEQLEQYIDAFDTRFTGFVAPGGDVRNSQAHVCRTVCRRAERRAVAAGAATEISQYLNRLSDWCFAVSKNFS